MSFHVLNDVECLSKDCVKCLFDDGVSFFLRLSYLEHFPVDVAAPGVELSQDAFADFMQAGEAFSAEKCAVKYLAGREHSRRQLEMKLLKKHHAENAVYKALDFLEREGWLSDRRFADEWLRCRALNHYEGRTRLLAELRTRGVSNELATEAVLHFFEENPEELQLEKAYKKLVEQGKCEERLIKALIRLGFSNKMIRKLLNE
ncbi:MAG: recombination regulator RecX [Treponemataceae bacterium]|nr:recombination regulator RecX [Treponemataceae bacterium]